MQLNNAAGTQTSDTGRDLFLTVTANEFGTRVGGRHVYLRHSTTLQFFGINGGWVSHRAEALRFPSNLDAIIYAKVLKLDGRIVAIDDAGKELYVIDVSVFLEQARKDQQVRARLLRWQEQQ